jgi:hypothetical protein
MCGRKEPVLFRLTGQMGSCFEVLNRVALNQVLARAPTDALTATILEAAQAGGEVWFGRTVWQGRRALRINVSSWRTAKEHSGRLVAFPAGLLVHACR